MESKIRVAQVIGKALDGGVESVIMNLYSSIDKSQVQFDFLVENTSNIIDETKIEELGGKVIIIPKYSNPIKYIKVLIKIFRENQYDIVHSNMNALSVFTLYAAKKAGCKTRIAHSHSTSNKKEWKKTIIKQLLRPFSKRYATHYIACSRLAGEWLFGKKTYNENKVFLLDNSIDIAKFKFDNSTRSKIRKDLDIHNRFVVGHVGRFVEQKNHMFLIEIFNEIVKLNKNSVLLLIGDGKLKEKIVLKSNELKIRDKIIFLGVKKNVFEYYNAMDCFLLPSLYEGLPVVGVEAQVNGLPCFFSDKITNEVLLLKKSFMVKLNNSAQEWANFVTKNTECNGRELDYISFINSAFDIKTAANKLLIYYKKILQGE